jgi:TrmH family RNA methyltransferase
VAYDIASPANDRIKWLLSLRDRRHRDAERVFVVEGERLYRRAISAGMEPRVTFVSADSHPVSGPVVTVKPSVLDKASYRRRSQGLIAVFPQIATTLDHLEVPANPLILIAEDIEKPGNLGAMLRTGAAAGVDAVLAIGGSVDPHNPNVLRASTGALFTLPLAVTTWDRATQWLEARSVVVLAATPDASMSLWDTDLTGAIAVAIGAEDLGLSERARSIASRLIAIPQTARSVDSLNASVAAGVVLFEAARQRTTELP